MTMLPTPFNESSLKHAVRWLRDGYLVAFPTETVYGLGADATNDEAVRAIYHTKGRPSNNPIIVHVADRVMAERYAIFDERAAHIADSLWCDALTLILPVRAGSVSPHILAGGKTIAVRAPKHDLAQALIRAFDGGIAAPSANRSGNISPTLAAHVLEEFAQHHGALRMILDGGHTHRGLESTVLDCTSEQLHILRAGSLDAAYIEAVTGHSCSFFAHDASSLLPSPGLLTSHYAPSCAVRLHATTLKHGEALLAFGAYDHMMGIEHACAVRNLSETGDLDEAAFHLYEWLRVLDHHRPSCIAVMPIPYDGVGKAINDRLQRASAPRTV